jgi:hypothetical protein
MREPHKFPAVLTGVMVFLTSEHVNLCQHTATNPYILLAVLFGGAGALSYLTFGSKINTVVLVNFDSESKLVQIVRFHGGDIFTLFLSKFNIGAIPVFPCYPTVSSIATLPRGAHCGKWVVHPQWKGQLAGQVVQESFQVLHGHVLYPNKLVWCCGP